MTVKDLVSFIKKNRGRAAQMEDSYLLPYLVYHLEFGYVKWVIEDGSITGVAIARRMDQEPESNSFWFTDKCSPSGRFFVVGDIICTTPRAKHDLTQYFLERWPEVDEIYGHDKHGNPKALSRAFIERLSNGNQGRSTPAKRHR